MGFFHYGKAFSRNLGWLTKQEQELVANYCVAIPGLGGVGGQHLYSLLRLGFQHFKIADFDTFDIENFNRQFGSSMSSVGKTKVEVLEAIAKDINPNVKIEAFTDGITDNNMESFLQNVDLVVDGLDVFVIRPRIHLFELAYKKNIPVVTAAPLGMGSSILSFLPKKMSFNSYFNLDLENMNDNELAIQFLAGISPNILHRNYVGDESEINFMQRKVPSLHIGCTSVASVAAASILKLCINRGKVICAPRGYQVDFYHNKLKRFWRPFGNSNPIQRLLIYYIKKRLKISDKLIFIEKEIKSSNVTKKMPVSRDTGSNAV